MHRTRASFSTYLVTSGLGDTGFWIAVVAQGWLVESRTHSPFWLGMVAAALQAPALLFSIAGGALADRVDRRYAIAVINAAIAATALATAAAVALGAITLPLLIGLAFVQGTLLALEHPLDRTLVFDLIAGEDVGRSVALSSVEFAVARVAGPAVGGVAIAVAGIAFGYAAYAACVVPYVCFALYLARTHRAAGARPTAAAARVSLRASVRWMLRERTILEVALLTLAFVIGTAPYLSLLPDVAAHALHVGGRGYGLLSATAGVGALAGAALLARLGETQRKFLALPAGCAVAAAALAALAFARTPALAAVALVALGAADAVVYALANTFMQERTADELRGRANAVFSLSFLGGIPIGNALAGALATRVGTAATLACGAAVTALGAVAFVAFASREVAAAETGDTCVPALAEVASEVA